MSIRDRDHHVDRPGCGTRQGRRARCGCGRLHHKPFNPPELLARIRAAPPNAHAAGRRKAALLSSISNFTASPQRTKRHGSRRKSDLPVISRLIEQSLDPSRNFASGGGLHHGEEVDHLQWSSTSSGKDRGAAVQPAHLPTLELLWLAASARNPRIRPRAALADQPQRAGSNSAATTLSQRSHAEDRRVGWHGALT